MADDRSLAEKIAERKMLEKVDLVEATDDVELLCDVEVPERFYHRIKYGVPVLDEIFGGRDYPGMMPGCSILFTGMPGAGKSTAAVQFADLLQINAGRSILYNAGEEDKRMVKIRADRMGVTGRFAISHFDDVNKVIKFVQETGVEVLIVDSIQQLFDSDDPELDGKALLKRIGKKLHKLAKDDGVIVYAIGHITKSGDFAGPMELKHDLDIHVHLRFNPDTMGRDLILTKNRFGPANIPYECNMSERGLDFNSLKAGNPEPGGGDGEESGSNRSAERRRKIIDLIKEAFLNGEHISGYCFTRFKDPDTGRMGVDCNGGYWRVAVERARKQLEADGIDFERENMDRREYWFVGGM